MEGAKQYLKMTTEFALNVEDHIRRCGTSLTTWEDPERILNQSYDRARFVVPWEDHGTSYPPQSRPLQSYLS